MTRSLDTAAYACLLDDTRLGPIAACRSFDFTIYFESAILSLLPACAFLVSLIGHRLFVWTSLQREQHRPRQSTSTPFQQYIQVALALSLFLVSIAKFSVVEAFSRSTSPLAFIAQAWMLVSSSAVEVISAAAVAAIYVADARWPNKSLDMPMLLTFAFLSCSCLLDLAWLRTVAQNDSIAHQAIFASMSGFEVIVAIRFAVQTALFVVAGTVKRSNSASLVSRLFFIYLLPTLWRGRRAPIQVEEMHALDEQISAKCMSRSLYFAWTGKTNDEDAGDPSHKKRRDALAATFSKPTCKKAKANDDSASVKLEQMGSDVGFALAPPSFTFGSFRTTLRERTRLARSIFRAMPGALLTPVLPKLVMTATVLLKPLLVTATLRYIDDTTVTNTSSLSHGLGLVLAFALVYSLAGLATGQYLISIYHNNCQLRAMLVQTVYIKALTLSAAQLANSSSSLASPTSLTSVDVERIVEAIDAIHEAWSALVILPVATYLLFQQVGLAFVATLITVLAIFAVIPLAARNVRVCQSTWSHRTDQRVGLMASIVAQMKAIKMSSPRLESFLAVRLLQMRAKEVEAFRRYGLRLIRVTSLGVISGELLLLATIATFAIMVALGCANVDGQTIFSTSRIFTIITILAVVDTPLFTIGQRYSTVMSSASSIDRISSFLRAEEKSTLSKDNLDRVLNDDNNSLCIAADLHEASFAWSNTPETNSLLDGVTLCIRSGQITGVFGVTGCGKSSLLCALLGELPVRTGTCYLPMLRRRTAYVSQVPWILDTVTIRQNILLGSDMRTYNSERYRAACYACGLDIDLLQLPHGDQSMPRQLSGGQRQRIALCRAVFSGASTYLLDDPFSALDAATTAQILVRLFGPQGMLKGGVGVGGNNKEAATVIMIASSTQVLSYCSSVYCLSSSAEKGAGQRLKRVEAGNVASLMHRIQLPGKGKHRGIDDPPVDKDDEDTNENADCAQEKDGDVDDQNDEQELVALGRIRWQVYRSWLQGTGIWPVVAYFILLLLSNGAYYGEQYWLQAWSKDAGQGCTTLHRSLAVNLGVFIAIQAARSATFIAGTIVFLQVAIPRTAERLHAKALAGVFSQPFASSPSSTGKDSADTGMLLNRFSQDLFTLDFVLTRSLMNLVLFGQDVVLALITMVIPAPLLIVVVALAGVLYFLMYKLYIPTSRRLRRVEMSEKTPLHAHLRATLSLSALLSIRADRTEEMVAERCARILDRSQKPYFLLWQVRACFQTWLNLLAALINTMLILFAVLAKHNGGASETGNLGVALVSATAIANMLNQLMVSYTEAEIASVSLERLEALSAPQQLSKDVKSEDEGVDEGRGDALLMRGSLIAPNLPSIEATSIYFDRVTLGYDAHSAPVLQDVTFSVMPGTRLAVVGRSGSGKSTLLLSLLGLLTPRRIQGVGTLPPAIYVGGTNLQHISKRQARAQTTVISQDPLVLPLSIRENLDPRLSEKEACEWSCMLQDEGQEEKGGLHGLKGSSLPDADLWEVLRKTGLDEIVRRLPGQLEHVVQTGTFSAGQRQLLCLARALVQQTPLVLFDEATAHIDSQTDARVQIILRQMLDESQATIVTIAHRIQTIIDYDLVLFLDHGRILEFDTPQMLLSSQTRFRAFADEQGLL
ncbi:hypothetical protein CBS101457_006960 [Exobasidium rhododendri]|nr:hypothetical protein CBS101457_006960 [Exobasidium rhododendri]